ncbi:hypothetical protein IFM89_027398 [Coptis chinensis]|uniref:Uncharacterized protein n=1 Tax=Coptis chinensis TaxID=261450 RepID=A0A835IGF9_9MAGN|nr:hypothetical protein IFM89_027398 [Coptis chinensis]
MDEEKSSDQKFSMPGNYAVSGGLKGVETVEAKVRSHLKASIMMHPSCMPLLSDAPCCCWCFSYQIYEPSCLKIGSSLRAARNQNPQNASHIQRDAQPHADPATIKNILAQQVTSPVQWETTVKTLLTKGLAKVMSWALEGYSWHCERMDKVLSLRT